MYEGSICVILMTQDCISLSNAVPSLLTTTSNLLSPNGYLGDPNQVTDAYLHSVCVCVCVCVCEEGEGGGGLGLESNSINRNNVNRRGLGHNK